MSLLCLCRTSTTTEKKFPSFFQSRPNPSLFVTQKKRKERKGNFGGKKYEEESVLCTHKFAQAHMCVCV